MTNEQAQRVLNEMQEVRPEQLKDEAKRLFEAIMKIADERDKIKQEYDRDIHILQNRLDLVNAENIKKYKILMQTKCNIWNVRVFLRRIMSWIIRLSVQ